MKTRTHILWVMGIVLLSGGPFISPALAGGPLKVAVSIPPQKYFVQRIGGNLVDVSVMVSPGSSPATYEPRPRQMVDLTRSKIYFAIGVGFEAVWLEKFAHASPKMKIVSTQDGIEKIAMKTHRHHGKGTDHAGDRVRTHMKDPHVWLSPPLVILQARHILKGLVRVDPVNRERYESGYRRFCNELVALDLRISSLFQDRGQDRRFMVYHPAWGYFAKAYDLVQIPVELEGKNPNPRELERLILLARDLGIRTVFVQPQFSQKSAGTVARAIGGQVVFADPLAPDWAENLLHVAEKIRRALK